MPSSDLPVVLVSAADQLAADSLLKEFLDGEKVERNNGEIVWEIQNKYYRCKVSVEVVADGGGAAAGGAEAHLVFVRRGEGPAAAARRAHGVRADVRLVAAQAPPCEALRDWCLAARYELVSLDPAADDDDDDAPDARGAARLRAALQAHRWPNLKLCSRPLSGVAADAAAGAVAGAAPLAELAALFSSVRGAARRGADRERREAAAAGLLRALRAAGEPALPGLDPPAP